jgi:hypothetical protein
LAPVNKVASTNSPCFIEGPSIELSFAMVASVRRICPYLLNLKGINLKNDMLDPLLFAEECGAFFFNARKKWRYERDCLRSISQHHVCNVKKETAVHSTGEGHQN